MHRLYFFLQIYLGFFKKKGMHAMQRMFSTLFIKSKQKTYTSNLERITGF